MRLRTIGLMALLWLTTAPLHAQVNLEHYLRKDGYGRIKISPDGQYYAATVNLEDRTGIAILRRSDKKLVTGASGRKDSVVDDFWWSGNDRIVFAQAERFGSHDQPYRTGQLFALGVQDQRVKLLVGQRAEPGLVERSGNDGPWEMTDLIDPLPDDPQHVLISAWKLGTDPMTTVDRLDVQNGRRKRVATAPVIRAGFMTDGSGQVRFAKGARNDNYSKLYYREHDQAEWTLINDQSVSGRIETPLGFSKDGKVAYLRVTESTGPDAIIAWDTRTRERKQVMRDAVVDPYDAILDRDGRTLIGARFMDGGMKTRLLDDGGEAARLYGALERAFPGAAIDVTSYTRDGIALVQVWNDRTPGETYLFDPRDMSAKGVFVQREWFDPAKLPKMRAITVPARDGLLLHGYLTLPAGSRDGAPLPMVVMPHGGPFGIFDQWAFDDDTQMLAEAGYAVLRINFRGSGNHGWAFEQAGAREWGAAMQDDLTDATRWAITQHVADPSRICIYGASYGAYAALMGAAREPGLYACAVGYVGVYDLEEMHRDDSRYSRSGRNWVSDWVGPRGDMAARSPTQMAARIKVPVFLAAGGADFRAPIEHSKWMASALRKAGNPAETLFFDDEGHGFYTEAHRREFYTRLLDFLARSLGGARAAPLAGDRH